LQRFNSGKISKLHGKYKKDALRERKRRREREREIEKDIVLLYSGI